MQVFIMRNSLRSLCYSFAAAALVLILYSCGSTSKFPRPEKIATPTSAVEEKLIREGIELHNQGKFRDAVKNYYQVLKTNPDCAIAMYELGYSYFNIGKLDSAKKYSLAAMNYKDEYYPMACDLAGTVLDMSGLPEDAVEVYTMGIEGNPGYQMLHYNRGVTFFRLRKINESCRDLQNSIRLNPVHTSSHFHLAVAYTMKYREVPASLASLTYLILNLSKDEKGSNDVMNREQTMKNSNMKELVETALAINLQKKAGKSNSGQSQININVTDMDFLMINLSIGLRIGERDKDTSSDAKSITVESTKKTLEFILPLLKPDKVKETFAGNYYSKFYYRLYEEGFTGYLANMLFFADNPLGWKDYQDSNKETVQKFRIWLDTYPWDGEVQADPVENVKFKKK